VQHATRGLRIAVLFMLCAWAQMVTPRIAWSAGDEKLVRCESEARETVRCKADTKNGVTLERQLSRAGCWYDETWGYDAKGIWVSNGCRADFALARPPVVGSTASSGTGTETGTGTTGSSGLSGEQVAMGAAAALVVGAIAAAVIASRNNDGDDDDDHSDDRRCRSYDRRGRCTDYYDDDDECRYRDSRGRCISSGSSSNDPWGRDKLVRCESQGHKERYCKVDTRRGVELYRQLSEARCRYGSTWGYDRKGIWVDAGCRGEFVIRG